MGQLVRDVGSVLVNFVTDAEKRRNSIESMTAAARELFTSAAASVKGGGDFGSRGEGLLAFQVMILVSITMNLHPQLEAMISLFIGMSATAYIILGVIMMLNAGYELKGNFSFFVEPVEGNKLVTTGIYRLVRHPMYGGAILMCMGCSIAQEKLEKIILSLAFAAMLVR